MRKLLIAFILILLAIWIGFLVSQDSGYVMVAYDGYTLETSLWFTILCLAVLFCLLYMLLRLTKNTRRLGGKYQKWDKQRKYDKARDLTNKGLCELAEGNWQEAQMNLTKAAKHHPNPLINHLAAARAAHSAHDYDARDEHLRRAHKTTKGSEVAVGLTQATLQIEGKQWEQALATLNHLNQIAPSHKFILKLLSKVHLELHDWVQLQKLLPNLKRHKVFDEIELQNIDKQIHMGLLNDAAKHGLDHLHEWWDNLPKKWRNDNYMLKRYTDYLIAAHDYDLAAELISKFLKKQWDVELVNNYGLAISNDVNKQISVAEQWLEKHPGEPELLLCLGRLCLKGRFYPRAEHVLETCIAASPMPEAYTILGQVFEALDKPDQALDAYKHALHKD